MAKKKKLENGLIDTLAELDSALAFLEGGKSEISIGNVRELRKKLFDLIKTNSDVRRLLFAHLAKK